MSYPSDRIRFVSERIVRGSAIAAAFALVLSFALFVPQPSIASPAETDYSFDVHLRSGPDGRVLVEVTVFAPDGERVMSSKATTNAGQPVRFSTSRGDRTYQVDVTPGGPATLQVIDRGAIVHHTSRVTNVAAKAPDEKFTGRPISLNLKDADLRDVMNTFSQLTGSRIAIDPGIEGKISINVTNMPWDQALIHSIEPLGLAAIVEDGGVRITRPYKAVGGAVKAPQVITRVEPQYPDDARKARVSGIVILETLIDEKGVVRDAKVLKDMPFGLGNAAADAVRQWTFAPALMDGKPVATKFNITVNFRLDEDKQQ